MKSATISAREVFHASGTTCLSAARWCEGECEKARDSKCVIWEAGDCTATTRVRLRRVGLLVTDVEFEEALKVLIKAGFELR